MVELLMLGIIPGTNIQINFANWLTTSLVLAAGLLAVLTLKKRQAILSVADPAWHYLRCRIWLIVLRIQLSWQLRKSATLF